MNCERLKRLRRGERLIQGPLRNDGGAATIELALLAPVFFLVMWFGAETAFHLRVENRLHRAGATLAELLANVPVGEGENVPDAMRLRIAVANRLLQDMMGDEEEGSTGIRVSYLNSAISEEAADMDFPVTLSFVASSGVNCPRTHQPAPLRSLVWPGGGLTTEKNAAKSELVRVEVCYELTERTEVLNLIFPRTYYSHYTTLRRE